MGRLGEKFIKYDDMKRLKELIISINKPKDGVKRPDIKKLGIPLCDYLVTTPNSVHYVGEKDYHTVIIDEVEMFLNSWHAISTHGGHYSSNWETCKRILQNASKIILMDAIPSYRILLYLDRIGIKREQISIVGSSFEYPKMNVQFITDLWNDQEIDESPEQKRLKNCGGMKLMLKKMIQLLKEGKKIYIFHPYVTPKPGNKELSRMTCNELVEYLQGHVKNRELKSYIYTGDSMADKSLKETLKTPNEHWVDKDIIVVNQSVTIGVNFDLPDIFDSIFAIQANWVAHRELCQTLRRIRHVKSKTIYYYHCRGQGSKDFNVEAFPDDANIRATIRDINNERKGHSQAILKKMMEKCNMQFVIKRDEYKVLPRLYKKYLNNDLSYNYDNIPDITDPFAYERLIICGAESTEDILKLTKHRFKALFKKDTPEHVLSTLWYKRTLIFGLNRYKFEPTATIKKVFEHLGLNEWDFEKIPTSKSKVKFGKEMRNDILKQLSLVKINPSKSTDLYLLSTLLNSYFGTTIMTYQHGSKNGEYQIDEQFIHFLNLYLECKKERNLKDDHCFLDDIELSPLASPCPSDSDLSEDEDEDEDLIEGTVIDETPFVLTGTDGKTYEDVLRIQTVGWDFTSEPEQRWPSPKVNEHGLLYFDSDIEEE
jgi:hypothetical protein